VVFRCVKEARNWPKAVAATSHRARVTVTWTCLEKVESTLVKDEDSHAQTPQTLYAGIPG
jgi:hypothetical protein